MFRFSRHQIEWFDGPTRTRCFLGPGGSKFNPFFQDGNFTRGQLRLRRHLIQIAVFDGRNQQTLFEFARNHRGARVAPFQRGLACFQRQSPLRFILAIAVAFQTTVRKNRTHFFFEEFDRRIRKYWISTGCWFCCIVCCNSERCGTQYQANNDVMETGPLMTYPTHHPLP